jgi:hypothetical protein
MSNYIKKGRTDCWPWMGDAENAPNAKSKMACVNPLCCNPRHVVEPGESAENESESAEAVETIESLREKCKELDIPVDKRWGIKMLNEVIQKRTG